MPIARPFSMTRQPSEGLRMRPKGSPRKIVSPANAPNRPILNELNALSSDAVVG